MVLGLLRIERYVRSAGYRSDTLSMIMIILILNIFVENVLEENIILKGLAPLHSMMVY